MNRIFFSPLAVLQRFIRIRRSWKTCFHSSSLITQQRSRSFIHHPTIASSNYAIHRAWHQQTVVQTLYPYRVFFYESSDVARCCISPEKAALRRHFLLRFSHRAPDQHHHALKERNDHCHLCLPTDRQPRDVLASSNVPANPAMGAFAC